MRFCVAVYCEFANILSTFEELAQGQFQWMPACAAASCHAQSNADGIGNEKMKAVSGEAKSVEAAIGFRVKSGWATAVLLAGPIESPQVLDRRIVELSDPAVPESRQPHHAGTGALEADNKKVAERIKNVKHCTDESVSKLLQDYRDMGCNLRGAGLAVGSLTEPDTITNLHIRAHALEGRLFRTLLEDAVRAHGLPCFVVVEQRAYAEAAAALSREETELKRAVSSLDRPQRGPWRAEEKMQL